MLEFKKKVIIPSIVAASLIVAGCDSGDAPEGPSSVDVEPPSEVVKTHAYKSVKECVAEKVFAPEYCKEAFKEALASHLKLAPKYETIDDCEADYGKGQCGDTEKINADLAKLSDFDFDNANSTVAAASQTASPATQTVQTTTTVVHEHHHDSGFSPFWMGYMLGGGGNTTTHVVQSSPVYAAGTSGASYRTLSGAKIPDSAFTRQGASVSPNIYQKPVERPSYSKGRGASEHFQAAEARATPQPRPTPHFESHAQGSSSVPRAPIISSPRPAATTGLSGGLSSGSGRSFGGGLSVGGRSR